MVSVGLRAIPVRKKEEQVFLICKLTFLTNIHGETLLCSMCSWIQMRSVHGRRDKSTPDFMGEQAGQCPGPLQQVVELHTQSHPPGTGQR